MKKFKGNRPLTDIDKRMSDMGMLIDKSDFNKGGDWVIYKGSFYNIPASIAFNVVTGYFSIVNGFTGEEIATHLSKELDDKEWYSELLNILYLPENEVVSC